MGNCLENRVLASFGMFMGPNNLMKKVCLPDKFYCMHINSTKKYGKFPLCIHSVNYCILLPEYTNVLKIYQRITTVAVCQPHQKIVICDFTQIFKNSNHESHNLVCESQIIISNPDFTWSISLRYSECSWWHFMQKLMRTMSKLLLGLSFLFSFLFLDEKNTPNV